MTTLAVSGKLMIAVAALGWLLALVFVLALGRAAKDADIAAERWYRPKLRAVEDPDEEADE